MELSLSKLSKSNANLGVKITEFITKSELVSSELTRKIFENHLLDTIKFGSESDTKRLFLIKTETKDFIVNVFVSKRGLIRFSYEMKPKITASLISDLDKLEIPDIITVVGLLSDVSKRIFDEWMRLLPILTDLVAAVSDALIEHAQQNQINVPKLYKNEKGFALWSIIDGDDAIGDIKDSKWFVDEFENIFPKIAMPRKFVISDVSKYKVTIENFTYYKFIDGGDPEDNKVNVKTGSVTLKKEDVLVYLIENSAYTENLDIAMKSYNAMEQTTDLINFMNINRIK